LLGCLLVGFVLAGWRGAPSLGADGGPGGSTMVSVGPPCAWFLGLRGTEGWAGSRHGLMVREEGLVVFSSFERWIVCLEACWDGWGRLIDGRMGFMVIVCYIIEWVAWEGRDGPIHRGKFDTRG
jgi:hypothetical protein